jgi:hypothetical protein
MKILLIFQVQSTEEEMNGVKGGGVRGEVANAIGNIQKCSRRRSGVCESTSVVITMVLV